MDSARVTGGPLQFLRDCRILPPLLVQGSALKHVNQPFGSALLYAVSPHGFQPAEPAWRHWRRWLRPALPAATARWLLDRGSLTARLVAASGGDFRVQVLAQRWSRPLPGERELLGMAPREQAVVREVLLHCNGEPWVYARSLMPASSLRGRLRHLRKLKDSALGALLFSDPGMRREPYQIARLDGRSAAIPPALRGDSALWGRRSCFYLGGQPIMVSEIFLPAFRPWV